MKPLVLMRGGGDIASGAVYRLKRAGYPVVINEIAIPTRFAVKYVMAMLYIVEKMIFGTLL